MRQLWMLTILAAWVAAGCGTAPVVQQPSGAGSALIEEGGQSASPAASTSGEQTAKQEDSRATVTVYFTDNQLSGLRAETREITFRHPQEKYTTVLELLGNPQHAQHVPLWKDFRFHSVKLENGMLTIDAKGDQSFELGGGAEDVAFEALTQTMFQFPEVTSLRILVDGKPADTLMGHVDISEPFTR